VCFLSRIFSTNSGKYRSVTRNEFQLAFDKHKDAVFRFAWRMTNSAVESEDITQEVFLSLLLRPSGFHPERGTLRSYLLGTARNLILKRRRDEYRWEELVDEPVMHPEDLDAKDEVAAVASAVRSLPPLQREVLILSEYEELSLEEIAQAVDAEVGTVKSRLHRARENLRRILAPLKPANRMRSFSNGTVK
jgi:RNA polymerase sigma factor (sigma-70 family)